MPYDYRTVTVESVTQEADAALARADALVERAVATATSPPSTDAQAAGAGRRRDRRGLRPRRLHGPGAPRGRGARCRPGRRGEITKWRVAIAFREDVYRAVAFAETPEAQALTGERARLLEHWMRDFRRAGTS